PGHTFQPDDGPRGWLGSVQHVQVVHVLIQRIHDKQCPRRQDIRLGISRLAILVRNLDHAYQARRVLPPPHGRTRTWHVEYGNGAYKATIRVVHGITSRAMVHEPLPVARRLDPDQWRIRCAGNDLPALAIHEDAD